MASTGGPSYPGKRGWRGPRGYDPRGDSGSIALLIAFSLLAVTAIASTMARSGISLIARARADAAADAVALSAVVGGDPGAVAEANGARLIEASRKSGGRWLVRVRVGDVEAVAAAAYGGVPEGGPASPGMQGGGGKRAGLAPETLSALQRADRFLASRGMPSPVPVVSGLRSTAEQQALWARRFVNPYPVAPPGTSAHERGLAVDVPPSWAPYLLAVAQEAGLCQPYPARDPIHFGPVESPECGGQASGSRRGLPILVVHDPD